jgi:hypothetical protein
MKSKWKCGLLLDWSVFQVFAESTYTIPRIHATPSVYYVCATILLAQFWNNAHMSLKECECKF